MHSYTIPRIAVTHQTSFIPLTLITLIHYTKTTNRACLYAFISPIFSGSVVVKALCYKPEGLGFDTG
jgi:hypothetical protein